VHALGTLCAKFSTMLNLVQHLVRVKS
jgi:hypothetical protein